MRMPLRSFGVTGESMSPTLQPGDRVVVRTWGRVRAGDVVVAWHPRRPDQMIVKRAVHRTDDGWWLESDNQRAPGRQDSWDFDAVPDRLVVGRVVVRYRPLSTRPISASALSRRRSR
jgi:nickel-type superoxide dismutase maturation protease